jgi:hypothetical protein
MAKRYNSLVDEAKQLGNAMNFPNNLLPQPLDIPNLYNLGANPHMWMIDATPTTNVAQLPPYLTDDNVRRGILSLLVQDRVKEEIFRLQQEHCSMIKWLEGQIQILKVAITNCEGMS